jgi:hypothetical protein
VVGEEGGLGGFDLGGLGDLWACFWDGEVEMNAEWIDNMKI